MKVTEMNEVKSDEMVPDWLWGGEKILCHHCTMAQAMEIEGSKIQKSKTSFYLQF